MGEWQSSRVESVESRTTRNGLFPSFDSLATLFFLSFFFNCSLLPLYSLGLSISPSWILSPPIRLSTFLLLLLVKSQFLPVRAQGNQHSTPGATRGELPFLS